MSVAESSWGKTIMDDSMSFRERVLRTFQRKEKDRILWQPRIYYWYNGRQASGTMPGKYQGMSMLEIYDDIGASPRYAPEVLGLSPFRAAADHTVKVHQIDRGEEIETIQETPVGSLRQTVRKGSMGSGSYHTEYPVKSPEDMRIMEYVLDHTTFSFDRNAFEEAERIFGHRGVVQTFYPRSPFQRLAISYMGFQNTVYALNDYRNQTEAFMKVIDSWDDGMYEIILESPLEILNFGENIDASIDSPEYFRRYLIPYYTKRVNQLHARGKFCHIHMDGSLKPLLPFINQAGFDGIEAATPLPQGDITLEELKEALGDAILLDGIPAVLFLEHYPYQELEEFAARVLEMFSPNLILGVSDEVPPPADIEKVRAISRLVDQG